MKKADLMVSFSATPPLMRIVLMMVIIVMMTMIFEVKLVTKTQSMKLTHMFMYSMAYMMLTLSKKLVISPKKTSTATCTRRKQVQWGVSPKTDLL